jgi:hypothetical protein
MKKLLKGSTEGGGYADLTVTVDEDESGEGVPPIRYFIKAKKK